MSTQSSKTEGPVTFALVGAGGFGHSYLDEFQNGNIPGDKLKLVAVAEPFPERIVNGEYLKNANIPIYPSMEELYRHHTPELTAIATPIPLHLPQTLFALSQGSHVLCEKPLVQELDQLRELEAAAEKSGRLLGVGFQLSFADGMLKLKEDIRKGTFGKLLRIKTIALMQRKKSYYTDSTWKGRGFDSIMTNASSHYLNNLYFLLGAQAGEAALPASVSCELYRAQKIETFDTVFVKGAFEGGAEFLYIASHSAVSNEGAGLALEFENALLTTDGGGMLTIQYRDGSTGVYGNPFENGGTANKMLKMAECVRTGGQPSCTPKTVWPHLATSRAAIEQGVIHDLPASMLEETEEQISSKKLLEDIAACYSGFSLPSEAGLSWSGAPVSLKLAR